SLTTLRKALGSQNEISDYLTPVTEDFVDLKNLTEDYKTDATNWVLVPAYIEFRSNSKQVREKEYSALL
ncbi:MAG: hypothetical protein WBA74_11880, partial [Cyclobacteriaceae bacterium]